VSIKRTSWPGRALVVALALAGLSPLRGSAATSPTDAAAYVTLAAAFMQKARESADAAYYARARAAVERALALDPDHYEALRARAWILVGLHEFRAALAAAEAVRAREPDDWWNYGTLADAAIELGDYARAVQAVDLMAALRPGLPAYTRIAQLRSLHGNRSGAIDALALAVGAGSRRDPESLAWTLAQLGNEHFAGGDLVRAARAYADANDVFPDYSLALGGLGRVRAAEGRLEDAAHLYRRALALRPAPELAAALGDVYARRGDAVEAEGHYMLVEHMERVANAEGTSHGRQLALFFADHDRRLDEALRLAQAEAATRADVFTDDALAWALFKNGRLAEAKRASRRARRLGTADAAFEYHAGMIATALGHPCQGARHLRRALALNPHFDLLQAERARVALSALGEPADVAMVARTAP
jgi:tetratricopeptide (TPR) repeat protein